MTRLRPAAVNLIGVIVCTIALNLVGYPRFVNWLFTEEPRMVSVDRHLGDRLSRDMRLALKRIAREQDEQGHAIAFAIEILGW